MSQATVSPSTFQMASSETLPLAFDCSALLGQGESVSSPTASLTRTIDGTSYPGGLSGAPSVSGSKITVTVTALEAGFSYRLVVGFTAAAGKVWAMDLTIGCVY